MPKRCIFDDDIECFAEGCFSECRHHPHSGIIYVKEAEGLKKEPKKHKRLCMHAWISNSNSPEHVSKEKFYIHSDT